MHNKITIQKHNNFNIVRDDLITGGTKVRPLMKILENISEQEVVYAADPFGYGPLALAEVTKKLKKQLTLFYPAYTTKPKVMRITENYPNVVTQEVKKYTNQNELLDTALDYAKRRNALFIPIGFDTEEFKHALIDVINEITIPIPEETWVLAGSGCLCRAISEAWPTTNLNVVSLGFPHAKIPSSARIYLAKEKISQSATYPPPYPSAKHYDAKLWLYVTQYAKPDALVWNVAG